MDHVIASDRFGSSDVKHQAHTLETACLWPWWGCLWRHAVVLSLSLSSLSHAHDTSLTSRHVQGARGPRRQTSREQSLNIGSATRLQTRRKRLGLMLPPTRLPLLLPRRAFELLLLLPGSSLISSSARGLSRTRQRLHPRIILYMTRWTQAGL